MMEKAPRRALIVDDSETIVFQLDAMLAKVVPDIEVYAAPTVLQARPFLDHPGMDVVFLDLNLAGSESGLSLLRSPDGAKLPPVILVTALDASHPDVVRAMSLGAGAHVGKPLRRANVDGALRACGFEVGPSVRIQ